MVSRSKRVISPNPVITTFFTSEANGRISTRKSDERDPRAGYRRVGRVKTETHIIHTRCHQLRRARYAYWGAWSTALGLISLQHGFHEPLYSEKGEGELGNGVQRCHSDLIERPAGERRDRIARTSHRDTGGWRGVSRRWMESRFPAKDGGGFSTRVTLFNVQTFKLRASSFKPRLTSRKRTSM